MRRGLWGLAAVVVVASACTATPEPEPAPSPSPAASVSQPVLPATPGVPTRPVAEHRAAPLPGVDSPDRQLMAGEASGLPAVPGEGLEAYWEQELVWRDCAPAQCATMLVPLDWEEPSRAALEIAVTRMPSRLGAFGPIFFNPGGPGLAAGPMVREFGPDLFPGFDLVGWDPRGVGESTSVRCAPEALAAAHGADSSPDDEVEVAALGRAWREVAVSCRELSGVLLDHVSTLEVARDLDLLRHLFKVPRASYLGISYGSLLGATYAELFPERVGRMVLDGAVEVSGEHPLVGLAGLEEALHHFAQWCGAETSCGLGAGGPQVLGVVEELLQRLDGQPLAVGEQVLTQGLAARGVVGHLYWGERNHPSLAEDLARAIDGDGAGLLRAAELVTAQDDGTGAGAAALLGVICGDRPDRGFEAVLAEGEEALVKAPILAASLGVPPMCEFWTAPAEPPLELRADGAPPILVIGRTGDAVTPYRNAVRLSERLASGRLLTVEGLGHVSLNRDDPCVTQAVARYLTLGLAPEGGASCPPR
ncbi:MAG: alpha/beta hydrolase [Propionibacteriaceae bacterium]|nr:alpha/beta hydrolase [Propionibacteriaceae bacterium]